MDIDQIAQRLEELSVDHDMPVLADLAEALIGQETSTCGPECSIAKQRLRSVEQILGSLFDSLNRAGFRTQEMYSHARLDAAMQSMTYANSSQFHSMVKRMGGSP